MVKRGGAQFHLSVCKQGFIRGNHFFEHDTMNFQDRRLVRLCKVPSFLYQRNDGLLSFSGITDPTEIIPSLQVTPVLRLKGLFIGFFFPQFTKPRVWIDHGSPVRQEKCIQNFCHFRFGQLFSVDLGQLHNPILSIMLRILI